MARGVPRERLRAARRRDRRDARASTPTANTISPASSSAWWTARGWSTAGRIVPGDVLIGIAVVRAAHQRLFAGAAHRVRDAGCRSTATSRSSARQSATRCSRRTALLAVLQPLLDRQLVKGLAHITGGGITDNLPRILPEGTGASIARDGWDVPPLFQWLQRTGQRRRRRDVARVQHGRRDDRGVRGSVSVRGFGDAARFWCANSILS